MSRYTDNPLIHRDRRLGEASSEWVRSFDTSALRPLIVCRGPIRKEAIDVFREMGMTEVGILLSEKDSIVYPNALAPELRQVPPEHVHRVPDYTGASKEEREERIQQIIGICRDAGYDSIFAGYGFMSEDADFVASIEGAGLRFIGPCSRTQRAAGKKDEAKRTALAEHVSVTPGVDDLTTRTLRAKYPDEAALREALRERRLAVPAADVSGDALYLAALLAARAAGQDLFSLEELGVQVKREVEALYLAHPGRRIRLKAIGGGGGKGQRILPAVPEGDEPLDERVAKAAATAPEKAREVLLEVKATGIGDDKNMLLELNVEETRHNEIQLVGNGAWCVALGGRDCSLQMHEQKLLEVSITREGLEGAIAAAREAGQEVKARALEVDHRTLMRMEEEGERFGRAVGLDSASTFECIVDGDRHYFMEVNTRIQVEHRVSELCYSLRFENPDDDSDHFVVESLVEAMALLSLHKERLPRPSLVPRFGSAVESRLNATDDALAPHAGGSIIAWSDCCEWEIRDDQGISLHNPDTDTFMRYDLAGAYDSNIALLVTCGDDRDQSYERLSAILRACKLRGNNLATNLEFHYGLLSWFRSHDVWAKPSTRFVSAYLAQVGMLAEAAGNVDVAAAYVRLCKEAKAAGDLAPATVDEILTLKQTLLQRPLQALLGHAHVFAGWLARFRHRFAIDGGRFRWLDNPLEVLWDTYNYLNMEDWPGAPPAYVIWAHDEAMLRRGLDFYRALGDRLGGADYRAQREALASEQPPAGIDAALWSRIRSADRGHQLGLGLLAIAPLIGAECGFFELTVAEDLRCVVPERLHDPALQTRMRKMLAPPPATRDGEIVAATGGMFYAQETPDSPPFIREGQHFDAGDPLYIIEVMKMFNRYPAPFAGTVDEVLIPHGQGVIVKKGQPLFKVTPDEQLVEEDPLERAARRHAFTSELLARAAAR